METLNEGRNSVTVSAISFTWYYQGWYLEANFESDVVYSSTKYILDCDMSDVWPYNINLFTAICFMYRHESLQQ